MHLQGMYVCLQTKASNLHVSCMIFETEWPAHSMQSTAVSKTSSVMHPYKHKEAQEHGTLVGGKDSKRNIVSDCAQKHRIPIVQAHMYKSI